MTGEQYNSKIVMVKENVKALNDISLIQADDPVQNGIGGLVEAVYNLDEASGSGDFKKIQPAALNALRKIGYVNMLHLPPEADDYIENVVKTLRELSKAEL